MKKQRWILVALALGASSARADILPYARLAIGSALLGFGSAALMKWVNTKNSSLSENSDSTQMSKIIKHEPKDEPLEYLLQMKTGFFDEKIFNPKTFTENEKLGWAKIFVEAYDELEQGGTLDEPDELLDEPSPSKEWALLIQQTRSALKKLWEKQQFQESVLTKLYEELKEKVESQSEKVESNH